MRYFWHKNLNQAKYTVKDYNNKLLNLINVSNVNWSNLNVSEHWNVIENLIINVIDEVDPLKVFETSTNLNLTVLPRHIKSSINK